jgi:hypothetical protein
MQKITMFVVFILVFSGFFYYFSVNYPPLNIHPARENEATSSLVLTMSASPMRHTAASPRIVTGSPHHHA